MPGVEGSPFVPYREPEPAGRGSHPPVDSRRGLCRRAGHLNLVRSSDDNQKTPEGERGPAIDVDEPGNPNATSRPGGGADVWITLTEASVVEVARAEGLLTTSRR